MDWSIFLFVLKWIFLILVYLALALLLVGVQREMRLRLPSGQPQATGGFGRMRVVRAGSDARLRVGATVPLQAETSVGSQPGNDLVLRDRYVSGHHARLRWDGVSWWVDDLNSTNGTFINQQRVPPGSAAALPAGAVLQIGEVAFEMLD